MSEQAFFVRLTDDDRIRVWIRTERGRVANFTVRYETVIGGRWTPVVRYDGWHDQPHRDTLDASGNVIHKDWFTLAYAVGLDYGLDDLKDHWQRYRADFLRRMR